MNQKISKPFFTSEPLLQSGTLDPEPEEYNSKNQAIVALRRLSSSSRKLDPEKGKGVYPRREEVCLCGEGCVPI